MKTYGADGNRFGHTDQDGVERAIRHALAGFAAVRFHRPPSGLELSRRSEAGLRALRMVETRVPFWELEPAPPALLPSREEAEAWAADAPGRAMVIYFPRGGAVEAQASPGQWKVTWIDVDKGAPGLEARLTSHVLLELAAPSKGNWIAVALREGRGPNGG